MLSSLFVTITKVFMLSILHNKPLQKKKGIKEKKNKKRKYGRPEQFKKIID